MRWLLALGGYRLLALLLASLALVPSVVLAATPQFVPAKRVRVTWHLPTGQRTYSGSPLFVGVAACSWEIPLGAVAVFADGRPVICLDRGQLGNDGWIDIYAPDEAFGRAVERAYGAWATVRLFLPAPAGSAR
jgi:hypothetical protein